MPHIRFYFQQMKEKIVFLFWEWMTLEDVRETESSALGRCL